MNLSTFKKRATITAVITVLALALTACGPFKAPTEAAKTFMGLLRTDVEAAFESTSPRFKDVTDMDGFLAYLDRFPEMTQVADSKFNSWDVVNDSASIRGTLTFDDGSTSSVEFLLFKESGVWKVGGFALNPDPVLETETEGEGEGEAQAL